MPRNPRVSVITPAYQAAATLQRAHDSLRGQSVADWEHMVVDDGSTDGTPGIIKKLLREGRVRSARIENSGAGAALNAGVVLALTGSADTEFLAFLDADDEYLPNHLAAHLEVFEGNPSVHLLWGGAEVITANPEDAYVPDVVKGHGFIHAAECVIQGTLFGRRRVFEEVRYSEDRRIWWQDYDFFVRASQRFKAQRFELPTYRYYRNSGGSAIDRAKAAWPA